MIPVVFVAPFFRETTLRFVRAAAELPDVRLGLVSQDPLDRLPPEVRRPLAAHARVEDALAPGPILGGIERLAGEIGGWPERLLGTLEELQVPLGELRDRLAVPGMGAEHARNFRDKSRMKDVLRGAGLPCARHALATSIDEALERASDIGFPIVVKPPEGSGARSTVRVNDAEQLRRTLATASPTTARPWLLEEFVQGEECSFDSVFVDGNLVWWNVNHYEPGPLTVLENAWIQWCVLSPREIDAAEYRDIRDVAARALEVLGMRTGLSHMEWFRRPDGSIAISEVGARPPGAQFTTLVSYGADLDLYRAWARLMVHGTFEAGPRPFAAGAAYLRGQGRGPIREIRGLDRAARELGSLVVESKLPEVGRTPSGTYEGDGYVILRHPETSVVRDALRRLVATVQVDAGAGGATGVTGAGGAAEADPRRTAR